MDSTAKRRGPAQRCGSAVQRAALLFALALSGAAGASAADTAAAGAEAPASRVPAPQDVDFPGVI